MDKEQCTAAMDLFQITLVESSTSSKQIMDRLDAIDELKSILLHEKFRQSKMDLNDSIGLMLK